MLVLSRKTGESIMLGDDIEIVVLSVDKDTVKLGITAPKSVGIYRKEIYLDIKESNLEASRSVMTLSALSKLYDKGKPE